MKKVILILMLAIGTFFGVKGQTTPGSGSINDILIAFDSEGKTGELYFDKDTQLFQGGWISYSIPNGGGLYASRQFSFGAVSWKYIRPNTGKFRVPFTWAASADRTGP